MANRSFAAKEAAATREYRRKMASDDARIERLGGFVRVRRIIGADDPRYDDPNYVANRLAKPRGNNA